MLVRAPAEVRVVFDDTVTPGPGIAAIRNGGGSILAGRARVEGARTLVVPLRRGLREGDYSVRWTVVSDDGHLESGVLAFAVGAGRAPPLAELVPEATGPNAGSVAARWLLYAGILVAAGIALFALAVRPEDLERVALILSAAAVIAAFGAGEEVHRVGLDTRDGRTLGAGFVAAIVVATAGAAATLERRALRPALVLALGLTAVPALAGHALDPGLPRVNVAADVLHVAAASAWVGVLVGLLTLPGTGTRRAARLALGAVLVLGATGVLRASFELTRASQLWDTSYGRALLVKTGLLLAVFAAGWTERARPRRRAAVELALLAVLLLAVGVLVQLRPPRTGPVSPPAPLACSSSSRRQTNQPIAIRKTTVCSAFIRIPPRFWSRTGESPHRRGARS